MPHFLGVASRNDSYRMLKEGKAVQRRSRVSARPFPYLLLPKRIVIPRGYPQKMGHNAKMTVNILPILALRSTQFDRSVFSVIYLIPSMVPKD